MERLIVCEVSQIQKAKVACFLSYVEYRPNKNISSIRKTGHSKGKVTNEGERERERHRRVYFLHKNVHRIFKPVETTIKRGLK
jgi:hypothetical protein